MSIRSANGLKRTVMAVLVLCATASYADAATLTSPRVHLGLPSELKGAASMRMRFSPIAYRFGNARETALTGTLRADNAVVWKLTATETKGIRVVETKERRSPGLEAAGTTAAMANALRTRNSLRV